MKRFLKINLEENTGTYTYSVLEQTHMGTDFAPDKYENDRYVKYKSPDNRYLKYQIGEVIICLASSSHPEIRKSVSNSNEWLIFVRGDSGSSDDQRIWIYNKTIGNIPIEEILTAVEIYNGTYSERISIKKR